MSPKYHSFLVVIATVVACNNDEPSQSATTEVVETDKPALTQPLNKQAVAAEEGFTELPTSGFRSNLPDWQRSNEFIVSAKKGHEPSHIMWGPFIRLPAGEMKGYVTVKVGETAGLDPKQRLCRFDVYDGKKSLAAAPLLAGPPDAEPIRKLPFSFELGPEQANSKVEFRMYCWGKSDLTVESVHLSTPT